MKAQNNSEILDSKLASTSQQTIQKIVQQLPEDTLSMAWRSSLNERLMAEPLARKPRFRFTWVAMPAAGLAVAASFAVMVFFHSPSTPAQVLSGNTGLVASSGVVEKGIIETYRQESVSHEIVGSGLDPNAESSRPSIVDVASDSYSSEVDPDSL